MGRETGAGLQSHMWGEGSAAHAHSSKVITGKHFDSSDGAIARGHDIKIPIDLVEVSIVNGVLAVKDA